MWNRREEILKEKQKRLEYAVKNHWQSKKVVRLSQSAIPKSEDYLAKT
jgi:hypothetical protein